MSLVENKILVTGGTGLLGKELQQLLPKAHFTGSQDLDVRNIDEIRSYLKINEINVIIHAAAFMPPKKSDENPSQAIKTNIIGTANICLACMEKKYKIDLYLK